MKASGFNPLKVRPFQGCGFKRQPAPLQHGGREPGDVDASVLAYAVDRVGRSRTGLVRGGKDLLRPEGTGEIFETGGHSGRFAARFEEHVHHR